VGLEVSAREIGGKTPVPLLIPLLSSSKSSGIDLDDAIACETASMPNTTHMVRLGTTDLDKSYWGLKGVSKLTVAETGSTPQSLIKGLGTSLTMPQEQS
jgi:hypothetical protein